MKNIFLFLSVLLIVSLTNSFGRGSPKPQVPKPPTTNPPVSSIAKGVHFEPVRKYTDEEKEVLVVSEGIANKLLQSKCFEDFMLKRGLLETHGKSPAEVVHHLKTTNLTVPLEMYSAWWSKVVGYRQPPALDIYTNRKFHAGANACSRASNLTHEWSHSMGYDHSSSATATRPLSVPYSINAAFSACCSCEGKTLVKCSVKP